MKTVLYRFNMGDVEDPEIYCAQPIWEWQKTEYGKWCMENCEPNSVAYHIGVDGFSYGYKCTITGDLDEKLYVFHQLKWSDYVKF